MIVTLPWDGIGKWNTRYCQLSSLLTSSLALKDILPSLKIYFFVLFFYDWEISHISCCCCCCRFSFLVFTVTLSPSIPPNLSLWNPNHHGRIQSSSSLKRSSSSRRWLRSSLSLSPNLCIHIHIHHAYIRSYVWIYVYYTLIHESDSCFLIDCHNWFSFLVFLLIDWLYIV